MEAVEEISVTVRGARTHREKDRQKDIATQSDKTNMQCH